MITYTYVIKNTGNATLAGPFSVSDDKLGTFSCGSGPLSPGASTSCTATYTITQADLDAGSLTNTATASGNGVTSPPSTVTLSGPCTLGYPDSSHLPQSSVIFNESEVLRTFAPTVAGPGDTIKVWYNDEHALTLGVRRVVVKEKIGGKAITTTTDYPFTPFSSSLNALNPLVGTTFLAGDQAGTDLSNRPMWPALFITDLTLAATNNSDPRAGDWQHGGTVAVPPHAVFGTWKAAVRTVDKTKTPNVVSVTPDADPAKNDPLGNARLDGGDIPPLGFTGQYPTPAGLKTFNEGYTAEVRWNVNDLGLTPGHTYSYAVHGARR